MPSTPSPIPAPAAKPAPAPVISAEADKAIFSVMKRYAMLVFTTGVIAPIVCGVVYMTHRSNHLLGPNGLLFYVSASVWLIPFYFGQNKVAEMRLEYGRRYAEEHKWKEASASVAWFDEFGQRSFDRTGEGHYLFALALDKLGKREKAEKMRAWVRKHRAATEWAVKSGDSQAAAKASTMAAPSASGIAARRSSQASGDAVGVGSSADGTRKRVTTAPHGAKPARRRRF